MEEKDYRRLNEIEKELRSVSLEIDKLNILKRDMKIAEEQFDATDRQALDLCNEIEETLIYNKGLAPRETIFDEHRELLHRSTRERRDFACDEIIRLDKRIRQLIDKKEELDIEKRRINSIR